MTVMHIQISDDLKAACEKAFPGEPIEAVVERLLRREVEQKGTAEDAMSLVEQARRIRERTRPLTDDEIWTLRQERRP